MDVNDTPTACSYMYGRYVKGRYFIMNSKYYVLDRELWTEDGFFNWFWKHWACRYSFVIVQWV